MCYSIGTVRTIAIGLLLLAVFVEGYHYQQKHTQPEYVQAASRQTPPKSITLVGEVPTTKQQESAYQKTASYLKKAFGPEYFAAWILVLAAGMGLYVTWRTARAALLSAQAVINAERAWISVTPHMGEVKFYPLRDNNALIPENLIAILPIAHLFPAKMVNRGKTPARIEGSAIRYVRTTLHPSKWNATPDYGVLSEYVHFAFPDETLTLTAELSPSPTMTQAQIDAVQNEKEFLYAFGIVKYRDVYGDPHETRFGYLYKVQDRHLVMKDGAIETIRTGEARFRIGGPSTYNGHT